MFSYVGLYFPPLLNIQHVFFVHGVNCDDISDKNSNPIRRALALYTRTYVQSHISQTEIILNTYNIEKIPLQNGAQRGARIVIPGIYL